MCVADCLQLLAPVVRHKLASPDQLGPEWDTLRAGVPGSYAVQQPASPSPIATPALPKAPGSGSGILQQVRPPVHNVCQLPLSAPSRFVLPWRWSLGGWRGVGCTRSEG